MARLDIDLDDEVHARAKAEAAMQRIALREYVRQALVEKLERDQQLRDRGRRRR